MSESVIFLLNLLICFCATFLSSISGCGSGIITLPSWIFMGYSLPVALAANVVNGALWTPVAARNYLRNKAVDWPFICSLVVAGMAGAFFGANFVLSFDQLILQKIIGVIILLLVIFAVSHKDFAVQSSAPATSKAVPCLLAFPLGFYEAFFGAGNGIFTSMMLSKTRGFELTTALGYYYVIAFFWCAYAAFVFISNGHVDVNLLISSSIGSLAGACAGSAIGSKKGSAFVKILFAGLGSILGLKLALGL